MQLLKMVLCQITLRLTALRLKIIEPTEFLLTVLLGYFRNATFSRRQPGVTKYTSQNTVRIGRNNFFRETNVVYPEKIVFFEKRHFELNMVIWDEIKFFLSHWDGHIG